MRLTPQAGQNRESYEAGTSGGSPSDQAHDTTKGVGPCREVKGMGEDRYTLKQVAGALDLPARKVQWLRERKLVVPSVLGRGRGTACYYTKEDILKVYLSLVCFEGISYETQLRLLPAVDLSLNECELSLTSLSRLHVDVAKAKEEVEQALGRLT